jgi:hypothetical protein
MLTSFFLLALPLVAASPAPIPVAQPIPAPTGVALRPTRTQQRRGIVSDISSLADAAATDISSVLSGLGSAIPSYVASGVPNFFQDFPTGDKVQSSLGLSDAQVSALPLQVLNIP